MNENETLSHQHLRILRNGPNGKEDWNEVAKLVKMGLCKASILPGKHTEDGYEILCLVWRGITPVGQDYADSLARQSE